jgi:hypothetical protein
MLFSMVACSSENEVTGKLNTNVSQNAVASAQNKAMAGFGVTVENRKIVGYRPADEYLEYVVVEYDDNGNKTAEASYFFYTDESYFAVGKRKYGDAAIPNEEGCYIKVASNHANTGSYKTDYDKLNADFSLKTP